mgnify:CR=1 FL=1
MTEKDIIWNRFNEEICYQDISELSDAQRIAVLCFWYDAEMNSGGYSGYMDCYPDTDVNELEKAILTIGNKELANNYHKAVTEGENDSWIETDMAYYSFSPSLCDYLQEYVEKNKTAIFNESV